MSVSALPSPSHNRAHDLLRKLLATIALQTIPFDELIVVDNASTDGAPELAKAAGCTVIAMGSNAGFAARRGNLLAGGRKPPKATGLPFSTATSSNFDPCLASNAFWKLLMKTNLLVKVLSGAGPVLRHRQNFPRRI